MCFEEAFEVYKTNVSMCGLRTIYSRSFSLAYITENDLYVRINWNPANGTVVVDFSTTLTSWMYAIEIVEIIEETLRPKAFSMSDNIENNIHCEILFEIFTLDIDLFYKTFTEYCL